MNNSSVEDQVGSGTFTLIHADPARMKELMLNRKWQ